MDDPVAQPSRFQHPESDAVRQIQELIDQQNSYPADGLIDSDVEACSELLKIARTVDLHLVSAMLDLNDGADVNAEASSRIQSWTLQYKCLLGSGGFAVVLAVDALPSGRTYAMKILRPSLRWSKSHQKRFLREAELTSLVSGSGIVPVVGTGLLGSHPFILSEHVDGPNLAQYLASRSSTLDVATAITWARSLAQSLHLAHEAGILHRDLKPENVLLQHSDDREQLTPRITDFGLARRFQQSAVNSAESSTGKLLVGTARYMAPEVATGRIHTGSIIADVYSLAAILFQCVTGRVPFDGRGYIDIVSQMQLAPAPAAHRLNPEVPASLNLVLQKALCRAPHMRYQTAAELDADLERVQTGQPVAARKSWHSRQLWEFTTSHPRATTAILVVALILPLALVATSVLYYREKAAYDRERIAHDREKAALQQHRTLLQATMNSVRDYINLSENVLDKYPASIQQRYEILKKAMTAQELVAQGLDYNEESRYRISVLHSLLADAAWRTSDAPLSLSHTRKCLEIVQDLLKEDPTNIDYRYDIFYNRMCLESRTPYETNDEKIAAKTETLRAIQDLINQHPDNPDFTDALASSYFSLGQQLTYCTKDDGKAEIERAIEISDELWPKYPKKLLYTKYSLIGRSTLADYHRHHGNPELAEKLAAQALAILKMIQHPERKDVWFLEIIKEPHFSYAAALRDLGRWNLAEEAFHECLVLEDQLYENNPLHTPYALGRAIFAAEILRAARKRQAGPERESELLKQAEQRLSDLQKTNEWSEFAKGVERLISDADAPAVR